MNSTNSIARPTPTVSLSSVRDGLFLTTVTRLLQASALASVLAACSMTRPVEVPFAIKAPAGQSLATVANAKGVQIYECGNDKGQDAWMFVGPEATLFDSSGNPIGSHGSAPDGAGPYWQAADGSRVIGAVRGRAEAPNGGAVAWLLLSTTADGPQGAFSTAKSIQRVNTVGGLPPTGGCTRDTHGQRLRVPYTATYQFFVEQRQSAQLRY